MRKGRLEKTKDKRKVEVSWNRSSYTWTKHIEVMSYLDIYDTETYVGRAELNSTIIRTKKGFTTLKEAFTWAEALVDYKKEVLLPYED